MMTDDEAGAPIDPRIQVELEKLNVATESINKYEIELDVSLRVFFLL